MAAMSCALRLLLASDPGGLRLVDLLFIEEPLTRGVHGVPQVIKLISQVIADFADGEINQSDSLFDTETTLEKYLDKSFYKTASLIASRCCPAQRSLCLLLCFH